MFWIPSLIREVRPVQDFTDTDFPLAVCSGGNGPRSSTPTARRPAFSDDGRHGWPEFPLFSTRLMDLGFNDFQRPLVRNIYIWLERITGRITTKLVVVSYANADKGEKSGVLKPRRLDSLPRCHFRRGIHAARSAPDAAGEMGSPGTTKSSSGMIACFKPQKSPVDFVDVAAEVLKNAPRAHFVMAGDGELRPQVEDANSGTRHWKSHHAAGLEEEPTCRRSIATWILSC